MATNFNVTQLTQQTGTADTTTILYGAALSGTEDTGLSVAVLFNSPSLTGTPTVAGYLTSALAASTYLTQANAGTTYLTQANASSTYATITNLNLKAPIASPTFTGTVVISTVTLSGGTIDNTVIGGTTAAAGKFSTIGATGLITPSTTVGIKGTTLADNAQAGSVGEFITSTSSATSIANATTTAPTSITLTAGDWDVWQTTVFTPAGSTILTACYVGVSTSSSSLNGAGTYVQSGNVSGVAGTGQAWSSPVVRVNIAAGATYYGVVNAAFATSTCTATVVMNARRVR
jgi:hypothetical protein